MRGAIAAGHPLTAEAGARVLEEGGNAVDACIAAGFASWVAESPLTGPGAGGFMLVHLAGEHGARLLDFFVTLPGKGLPPRSTASMEAVDIDYDRSSSQVFHIGAGSVAVPGTVLGLAEAHRAYASRPWRELIAPAAELARRGFELSRPQAYLHAIVDLILRHTDEGRRLYGRDGNRLVAGDRLVLSDLGDTLDRLAEHGAADFYTGELARTISGHVLDEGGLLTLDDLEGYRIVRRRPIHVDYLGHEFVSNPPPSSGGLLIGYGLQLLDRIGTAKPPGSAEAVAQLAEVMRETTRARGGRFVTDLHRGGAARRLYSEESLRAAEERIAARQPGLVESAPHGTTHISVVDGRGNAASMTASNGAGSGVIVPGTGVLLNNMLGEYDLNPGGSGALPGRRLTSMMAPSIVLEPDGRPRLVVGSAGSVRLRNAIFQIVVDVLGHGEGIREAIDRPRVHLEEPHVHCEGGHDPAELDRVEAMGYDIVRWRRRNLYFGGAAGVEFLEDGRLSAAGDPRRGGHGIVVE
jgi:gamma-glutamyltranspeptidase/glutathione hydrolase